MKKVFAVEGLGCANCAAKMERGIGALEGVTRCAVNFMAAKLTIEAEPDAMEGIVAQAEKIVRRTEAGASLKRL